MNDREEESKDALDEKSGCGLPDIKLPKGYYECDIYEPIEDTFNEFYEFETSKSELEAILEAEKWDRCYKELETRWKEESEDDTILDEKSGHNIVNELYDFEEYYDFEESENWIEELGDFDLVKYYCESEREPDSTEPREKYSEGCEWYGGKLYINTNKLGGLNQEEYYEEIDKMNDDYVMQFPSKEVAKELQECLEESEVYGDEIDHLGKYHESLESLRACLNIHSCAREFNTNQSFNH